MKLHIKPHHLSYQSQIFLALLILLIIPSVFLGIIFAVQTAQSVSKEYENSLNSITQQIDMNIDTLLADAEKICNLHLINDDIRRALVKDYSKDIYKYAYDSNMMSTQISQANRLNPNVVITMVQNKYGYLFSYGTTNSKDAEETVHTMNSLAEYARKDPHHSYVGSIYNRKYSGTMFKSILPMVKILTDPNGTNTEIGIFYVGVNFNAIANILENSDLPNSKLAFLNRDNQVFFSSDELFTKSSEQIPLMKTFSELAKNINEQNTNCSYKTKVNGIGYDINIALNKTTGWKIVHFMDNSIVTNANKNSLGFYSIVFLINILFGLLLAYLFSRRLTRSISTLCSQIDSCNDGNTDTIQLQHNSNRELQKVIDSYNKLNHRLIESIHQNYIITLNEKQIKLKMLQMQINPHFLYNTLNIISSLANIHDVPEIKTISASMSDILRYNLKSGPIVTISDEIAQIHKYVNIQQLRFPEKFILECAVSPGLETIPIPAFVLQPLIENAVTHGLEEKETDGYISINVYSENDDIHILIADNGKGMTDDALTELLKLLQNSTLFEISSNSNSSIGIVNVHQRIQTYYGHKYGLTVESKIKHGTLVDIKLPLNKLPQIPSEI